MAEEDRGLTNRIGPIEVDWPQAIGYFGAIGLAATFGLIEPPIAIFIAAVPFFKVLNRPHAPRPTRFVGQVLEGAAKPVGGDGTAAIRFTTKDIPIHHPTILEEARYLADRARSVNHGAANSHS
jgi:hypothetical protein